MSEVSDEQTVLYRALFETAPDAMVVVDRSGRIVLANPQATRLFGYPIDELQGQAVEILLPENVRDAHHSHKARYME
ncbi:MAG TPA: PAS domain S-box protein, partial [Tahibacter sp.]|nr:PAS domain S-box protein [Tahibacter sp.]